MRFWGMNVSTIYIYIIGAQRAKVLRGYLYTNTRKNKRQDTDFLGGYNNVACVTMLTIYFKGFAHYP